MNSIEVLAERYPQIAEALASAAPFYVVDSLRADLTDDQVAEARAVLSAVPEAHVERVQVAVAGLVRKVCSALDDFVAYVGPEVIVPVMASLAPRLPRPAPDAVWFYLTQEQVDALAPQATPAPDAGQIVRIAQAAHEVNRVYCIAIGDDSQVGWDEAPDWQRVSAIRGVEVALAGATPVQQHVAWVSDKTAAGWKYGPVKDPAKKEHPCIVPYRDLPPEQRRKDALYGAVVRAMAEALR